MAMARMLEQIAKEVGGVHSNRHEITGRDRGPIQFAEVSSMTDEQIEAELEAIWAKASQSEAHGGSPRSGVPHNTTKH